MAKAHYIIVLNMINNLISMILSKFTPWKTTLISSLPYETLPVDLASKLCTDANCIKTASSDFGKLVQETPSAVFYPSTNSDIARLVKSSYDSSSPFKIAARGNGHCVGGQAMAKDGVVVEMSSLNGNGRIRVSWSDSLGFYADVGGEQLWIDVLRTTMEQGLAPVSWTDYLYLTVGGTLSNAGISGQAFLHGPQITNVHEMDVITGKGDIMTCSKSLHSELFYGVLGGLGQFGIITRARIVLHKAPSRVKWVRMIYEDFGSFTKDQEHLISINNGPNYVEGSLIMKKNLANNWRSSFFSTLGESKVNSLASKHGIVYSLEVVKYYDEFNIQTVNEELEEMLKGLSFKNGFKFEKDVSFEDFLNRVRIEELKLQSKGLWDVPHPWLNLFVPKSRILDFNQHVFIDIVQKQNKSSGPFLVYPMNRKKWDGQMSAVIPDDNEDVFYSVGLLHSAGKIDNCKIIDDQNKEILEVCDEMGIKIKQYLPRYYKTKEEWMKQFGGKWNVFEERKAKYDPKMILSPGQRIFNFN
ncbi:cytokinin dehydrogenase 3 [Cynara cardunculus var. scolymus]|uniref:cytokinin dehydrogenase 3 n=1 Tax=Cynara cardunculus var. scolymus TaxID=59895 RepID=UPI000D62F2F9|nr:cytokinin dehydrogenase 3 [Cynara cardunculus var. scolymus]